MKAQWATPVKIHSESGAPLENAAEQVISTISFIMNMTIIIAIIIIIIIIIILMIITIVIIIVIIIIMLYYY